MLMANIKNQKKKYKALILDVDGTLIPNKIDGLPSKKVIQSILKANKFLHVGVATSRGYELLSHIAKCLKLSGPSITHAGSRVIDIASQKILWEKPIEKENALKITKFFEKYNLPISINDDGEDVESSKSYSFKKPLTMWTLKASSKIANFLIKDLSKISNISAHKLPSWVNGQITISITHSSATKKHALLEVARLLKIQTSEIIGVGDGHNDLSFLSLCGLKIVMGNAHEEVKKIADYIAPPVEDDGVADVIEKFIL
jgi:hypothetical protein